MKGKMSIKGWDRRHCPRCNRPRVHYRTGTDGPWKCIGKLRNHVGARCGEPVSK